MITLTNDFHRINALTPTYAPSYSTPSLSVSIWELVGMIPPEGPLNHTLSKYIISFSPSSAFIAC
ncbi:hypothetical protein CMV16_18205 [Peribacillus simplex]|nr:hypothetical protein CMV16_18205 [Peribacillus simplex]